MKRKNPNGTCYKCNELLTDLNKQKKGGFICKVCAAKKSRERYHTNEKYRKEKLLKNSIYSKTHKRTKRTRNKHLFLGSGTIQRYGVILATQVYEKYNFQCDMCKTKDKLTFHHINHVGRGYFERTGNKTDDRLENLQLLCRRCHGHVDGKRSTKEIRLKNKSQIIK